MLGHPSAGAMSGNPFGLRPFQLEAVDKLDYQYGALIADEPGLGKTFMAGERDRRIRQRILSLEWRPTLIVCPKAMLYTWGEWLTTHRPDESLCLLDPAKSAKRSREAFLESLTCQADEVYLLHYEGVRMLVNDLVHVPWWHVILDEAHRIGNRKSQTSRAVRALRAEYRTALTATPANSTPEQIWPILNFLYPTVWPSFWRFAERYVDAHHDSFGYRHVLGVRRDTKDELQGMISPYFVRRRKEDVLPELPKQYQNVWVDLSPKQRRAYDQMRKDFVAWVGQHEDQPLVAPVVIAQLIRLQQIALATPTFVEKEVWKIDEDGQRYQDVKVEIHLDDPSSKLDAAMELIVQRAEVGHKTVVFSQFSRAIDLLGARLDAASIPTVLYHGGIPPRRRNEAEHAFREGEALVFAGTITAGGTGLNLQVADMEIFLDRDWSGGPNRQVEDRVHRIGQKSSSVTIVDIMARGTVDAGRHQHFRRTWREIQTMIGDRQFDWTHPIYDEIEEVA
jgi:SNF2 family DNA or RNA helicase